MERKPVVCVETGVVYDSIKEASERTGIQRASISKVCLKRPQYITAGGFHWKYHEKD